MASLVVDRLPCLPTKMDESVFRHFGASCSGSFHPSREGGSTHDLTFFSFPGSRFAPGGVRFTFTAVWLAVVGSL